jgi:hypothetical protein
MKVKIQMSQCQQVIKNTDSAKKNNNEDSKSSFIDEVEKSENSMTTESGKIED